MQPSFTVSNPINVLDFIPNHVVCEHTVASHFSRVHLILFIALHASLAIILSPRDGQVHRNRALMHYTLVWLALVSSPRGAQMDLWLSIMLAMDALPLVMALGHTVVRESMDYPSSFVESLLHSHILDSFSAAFQMHRLLIELWNGDFTGYISSLILIVTAISNAHSFFNHTLYCTPLS